MTPAIVTVAAVVILAVLAAGVMSVTDAIREREWATCAMYGGVVLFALVIVGRSGVAL